MIDFFVELDLNFEMGFYICLFFSLPPRPVADTSVFDFVAVVVDDDKAAKRNKTRAYGKTLGRGGQGDGESICSRSAGRRRRAQTKLILLSVRRRDRRRRRRV